ncbi:MAG TPA: methyltransferase domain-containing protein [Ornithinibacter sp.]|nr:methyltransferase domain-containing protein [Ornithinibacter sp.]
MFGDARAYDRFMGRWSQELAPRFLDAVELGEPTRVLDVGCGTGNLTRAVAERWPGCQVVGVDPSVPFVEAARERAGLVASRVRFEVGEAGNLPLDDDSVDAAVALLVLTFVPDADRAVAQMRRVTRPGGVLAAAVWDYGERMQMLRTLWDAAARLDPTVVGQDEATMPLGRPGGLIDLWQRSGLDDVDGSRVGVSTSFEDFDDYWEPFLRGQGPAGEYVAGLSDAARTALRDEVAATVGEGPFDLSATAWWVRGTVPREA